MFIPWYFGIYFAVYFFVENQHLRQIHNISIYLTILVSSFGYVCHQNPWAVVMFEGQKKTTQPVDKGNLEPQFDQTWTFQRNAGLKIQLQIFKKETIIDANRNPKEQDLLVGQGSMNEMATLKKAIKKPLEIVVDLYYDFDNKIAG